jgi:hypothetical protein
MTGRNLVHFVILRVVLCGSANLRRRNSRQTHSQRPVNAASSTSRCNTIHCVDSTMLARENHLFGCPRSKPSQSSVPTGLALASDFGFCFQCQAGSSLVLRRPIEITVFSRSWVRNLGNAASEGHQQTLRDKSGTISHNAISGPLDGFGLGRYNPVRTSNYAPEES